MAEVEAARWFREIMREMFTVGRASNISEFLSGMRWMTGFKKMLMVLRENRDGFMQELIEDCTLLGQN